MKTDYIGKIVHFHRKSGKLTREKLALLSGVGKTVIYDIENGKQTIRLETLMKVLCTLNIKIRFESPLMHLIEEPSNEES